MKLFIYTVPKSGTYLLAEFMGFLGFSNTGYHVSINDFLDTRGFGFEENSKTPSVAEKEQFFSDTLLSLREGEIAFGHLPAPLVGWAFPDFKFICSYRHPEKTLLSEFVDFRFRRDDVNWLSRDECPNDIDAFAVYLRNHGPIHLSIFSEMLAVAALYREPLLNGFLRSNLIFVNFDCFLRSPVEAVRIADRFDRDPVFALQARQKALAANTKTKAVGLEVDRESFWNEETKKIYAGLKVEALVEKGRELGLDL